MAEEKREGRVEIEDLSEESQLEADGEDHPSETEASEASDDLLRELDEIRDRHLRLAAEFENYRRRAQTERTETWGRAQADLVARILDAVDDLERVTAIEPAAASVESLLEGVQLVERKLLRALEEAGAEAIDPQGEVFDPSSMEAMLRVPAESEEEDDRVRDVYQKGYRFRGHLVRPARVTVAKFEE